jgi:hypothetical protein
VFVVAPHRQPDDDPGERGGVVAAGAQQPCADVEDVDQDDDQRDGPGEHEEQPSGQGAHLVATAGGLALRAPPGQQPQRQADQQQGQAQRQAAGRVAGQLWLAEALQHQAQQPGGARGAQQQPQQGQRVDEQASQLRPVVGGLGSIRRRCHRDHSGQRRP